jgi:acetoin utilization deacetylase AcuC-like enzyme
MATALFTHPDCVLHEMGPGHPESPARLKAILAALEASGLAARLSIREAPLAEREHLERVHDAAHVDLIFESSPGRGYARLDPDTSMNASSLSAALRAAGAVVAATDAVMSGEARTAFCAVRPPGHHATPARAMGFCIFNNVAIGAMHAIEAHGAKRVAILDFDVHHGNGTEDAFHEDPRVMLCSTFQHPYYPYCGAESGNDHIINVPLPAMTDGRGFREAVQRAWLPALERFAPEVVFVSAGFDAHRDDPLAYLELADEDYTWVTQKIVELAARHARGRVVSTLEGGYDTGALARCVVEHVRVLDS